MGVLLDFVFPLTVGLSLHSSVSDYIRAMLWNFMFLGLNLKYDIDISAIPLPFGRWEILMRIMELEVSEAWNNHNIFCLHLVA